MKAAALLALFVGGLSTVLGNAAASMTATTTSSANPCPNKNRPNRLVLVSGSPQTAKLGTTFATDLRVALANKNSCPLTGSLSGVAVTFTAPDSGPSGTFASSGSNRVTVGTDSTGTAAAPTFTANDDEGSYEVDAESAYGSVSIELTNTATGVASSITVTGQGDQATTVNRQYPQPLQARVVDSHGSPVRGETVTFSVATGSSGASASFVGQGSQATVQTDADGQATSPLLFANGTPGRFAATASVDGVSADATFTLTNHAAVLAVSAGGPAAQLATINSRYKAPLRARVLDDQGLPLEGVSVTFTLSSGPSGAGATFLDGVGSQSTALTNALGTATSSAFDANGTVGAFIATASVAGGTAPVTFRLRNRPGRLTGGGLVRSATVGLRYRQRLRARMVGEAARPLEGVSVTFTIAKGANGATAGFPDGSNQATVTTSTAGWATSPPLTANGTAGRFGATATSPGSKPVTYRLHNQPGTPIAIAVGAASGQSTPVGTRFPIRLAVTLTDAQKNPVVGATVLFSAPRHGAGGYFTSHRRQSRTARVRTNAAGVAIAPPFTANRVPGGYIVTTTSVRSRKSAAFALVNEPR